MYEGMGINEVSLENIVNRVLKEMQYLMMNQYAYRYSPNQLFSIQTRVGLGNIGNINNKETDMGIVTKIRNLSVDKTEQLRRKFYVTDENGTRTTQGTDILLDILFEENKAKIDAKLALIEAEEKKAEDKK